MAQQISANCVVCHTMSLWAKGAFAVFPEREKRLWDNSLRCKKDTYLISSFIIEFFEEILQPTRCVMKLCLIKQTEVYKLCVIQMLHKILGSLLVSLQHCGEVWPGSQVVACVTLRGNQFKNSHIYIVGNSSKISFFLKKKIIIIQMRRLLAHTVLPEYFWNTSEEYLFATSVAEYLFSPWKIVVLTAKSGILLCSGSGFVLLPNVSEHIQIKAFNPFMHELWEPQSRVFFSEWFYSSLGINKNAVEFFVFEPKKSLFNKPITENSKLYFHKPMK